MLDKSIVLEERHHHPFLPEIKMMFTLSLGITFVYFLLPLIGSSVSIWGYKDEAIFDIWSLEHVASGMGIAYFTISQRKWFKHPIGLLIIISGFWEVTEHYFETDSFPFLMDWFTGTEHWVNRLLSDQLAILFGFTLIKAFPGLILFARVFSISFVSLHICLGSSMYFH